MNIKPDAWIDTQDLELMREKGRGAIVWHHKQDGYAQTALYATQPPQDERGQGLSMDTMQAIYAKAWSRAADWANRHDLHSDIGSPAYLKDMAIELVEFADVAAAPPVALSTLTDERIHPNRQFSMIGKLGEKLARLLDEDQWAECEAMLLAIEHGPWQNLAPAASMDEYSSECLECGGTGMRDSGGFQPWGEAASVPCDCGGIQAMADRIRSERAVAALVASAPAQQAPAKLTRYDRDEGGMFPSESGDWVLYEELAEQMATPPQPVAAEAMKLSVIRHWPEGFEDRLQHVWLDVVSFIPNVKLYDLQRMLAEFGFRMEIYDAAMAGTGSDESKENGK